MPPQEAALVPSGTGGYLTGPRSVCGAPTRYRYGTRGVLQFHHVTMEFPGKTLAIRTRRAMAGERDRRLNARLGHEIQQVRHEGHVPPVTNLLDDIPLGQRVVNESNCDRIGSAGGGLEQG